jgi:hypothetical protein
MADFGTFNGRTVSPSPRFLLATSPAVGGATHTEYDVNIAIGTINARSVGGGGGVEISYVDRVLYDDAPPSTNGAGDWGMRFYGARLEPSTVNQASITEYEDLYVCPAGSRIYIREIRLYNNTNASQAVKLFLVLNGPEHFPLFNDSVDVGQDNEVVLEGLWILGPGEVLEGSGPAHLSGLLDDGKGVWCWVSGVEEVEV